ncbi:MAG: sugar phosphate isomerase/epimerase [Chitinophagaceae bacterium]|nr:MAG: sugar phosphate isomerase/epimerase [Chitinophagaceae bacterium]
MRKINRRQFIQQSSIISAALTSGNFFQAKPKFSFSTLGCPDWTFEKILDFATTNNFNGIEIRGILRETDINKIPAFSPSNLAATNRMLTDKAIPIVNLGSSAALHHPAGETRTKHLDEAKQYIDLASKLSCPFIRVFPNNLPKDDSKIKVLDLIAEGLTVLSNYANGSKVRVLMETHGDLLRKDDLSYVMKRVPEKNTGLIWDIMNAWSITKEDPALIYPPISKYIYHVHVKDGVFDGDKLKYTLLGKGVAPIKDAVQLLHKNNYSGYYSFEWEKLWHPEIAEPELAFPPYPAVMKTYLS